MNKWLEAKKDPEVGPATSEGFAVSQTEKPKNKPK